MLITRTAAEVTFESVADLGVGGIRIIRQELLGGHDHSRRTESALQSVLVPEGLLQRVERAAFGEAFDGDKGASVGLDGEHGAGFDRLAVKQNGAGAADRGLASDMRSRKRSDFAQIVDQKEPWLDFVRVCFAVNGERDFALHGRNSEDLTVIEGIRIGRRIKVRSRPSAHWSFPRPSTFQTSST